ncbi:MAG: nitroreductase family protein [Dehalococcoidia bacterium]|nr:nitroreductase family protein [Dehalococcoidia bacterium]
MITNPIIETLMNRRSVRKYADRKLSKEELETIVRAGQQAPFASQLYSVLHSTEVPIAFKASIWFAICVDAHKLERFMRLRGWDIVTNDLSLLLLGMQDAAYMAENMVIAAESLGIGSCFLGEGSLNASRVRALSKRFALPKRVLPMVELVMGYPDEDFPTRPRYPLAFTLFENRYPELSDEEVRKAMKVMDDGYLEQEYYRRYGVKIDREDGRDDGYGFDTYSWTEHISRKWGQWAKSPNELLDALKERGFCLSKEEE